MGRDSTDVAFIDSSNVSIHAPAWGATRYVIPGSPSRESFNPRARVGRDVQRGLFLISITQFQSTRPRGARLGSAGSISLSGGFNPRARVGRDKPSSVSAYIRIEFQSTRPRGARPIARRLRLPLADSFNPRARVGRDPRPAVER